MAADEMLSWLRSTITAEHEVARAADQVSPGPWVNTGQDGDGDAWQIHGAPTGETEFKYDDESGKDREVPVLARVATLNYDDGGGVWEQEAADHIVLQQPRDTIARCEAELDILDWHTGAHECSGPDYNGMWVMGGDDFCPTMKALVRARRHRPGFKPEWVEG